MSKYKYPVDTDQFQKIREEGYLYVDKTDMMFNLVNRYNYVFLARPRRFGKSLLCNTFKAYFQGQKELFEACPEHEPALSLSKGRGLKIMELEKEWKTYPVLHFTMSGLKNLSVPLAQSKLENFIEDYEKIYGRNPSENTPGARFRGLIHRANEQTGEKVVVILDEYDSAILRLMYEKEQLDDMRSMLREFYQVLKDEGAYVVFSLLNSKVDTEVKSIIGRADVVIKTKNDIFVLELKVDDTVENALAQIDDKGYAIPYEDYLPPYKGGPGRVFKCGISISSEHRNITHWRITDAIGNVIEDRNFLEKK